MREVRDHGKRNLASPVRVSSNPDGSFLHPDRTMPPSAPPQDTATVAAKPLSRKRRILVWTLVVLASVIAAVGIMTTWVKRQMLDNAAWNRATTQMVQDPKVQGALSTYM